MRLFQKGKYLIGSFIDKSHCSSNELQNAEPLHMTKHTDWMTHQNYVQVLAVVLQ